MNKSRFPLLVLVLTAAVCVGAILLMRLNAEDAAAAQVYQDGRLLYTLELNASQVLTVTAPNGGTNTIAVERGRICVSHASCPDQICVKQGWVSQNAVPIVCLPNQLVIQIKGGESQLDAATG